MLDNDLNWIKPLGCMILAIALFVMALTIFNKNKTKPSPYKSIDALTDQQKFHILRCTPTSQLDLMEDVLLVSLAGLYPLFHTINIDDKTLFEIKYEQVLRVMQRFLTIPSLSNTTATMKSTINTLLIVAFYRALFFDVIHENNYPQLSHSLSDPWVFLKRIPTTIHRYVGSQTWRLYELKTLIAGSLEDIAFNKDLVPELQRILGSKPAPHYPLLIENNKVEPHPVKTHLVEKSEENPLVNTEIPDTTSIPHLSKTVKGWLIRQLKRYPINSSQRFYMDIVNYGKHTLFISDIALSDLSKKLCKPVQVIQALLIEQGICSSTRYVAKVQSGDDLPLLSLTLDDHDDIEITHPMEVTIEEMPS